MPKKFPEDHLFIEDLMRRAAKGLQCAEQPLKAIQCKENSKNYIYRIPLSKTSFSSLKVFECPLRIDFLLRVVNV